MTSITLLQSGSNDDFWAMAWTVKGREGVVGYIPPPLSMTKVTDGAELEKLHHSQSNMIMRWHFFNLVNFIWLVMEGSRRGFQIKTKFE